MALLLRELGETELRSLAKLLKGYRARIKGSKGWVEAQVSHGGVALEELNAETLESLRQPGLYVVGEAMDADGPCGGYNLHWAWASGLRAGRAAAEGARHA